MDIHSGPVTAEMILLFLFYAFNFKWLPLISVTFSRRHTIDMPIINLRISDIKKWRLLIFENYMNVKGYDDLKCVRVLIWGPV